MNVSQPGAMKTLTGAGAAMATKTYSSATSSAWTCFSDRSLTDTDSFPPPDVIATEIADDLETALEQFTKIAARLGSRK